MTEVKKEPITDTKNTKGELIYVDKAAVVQEKKKMKQSEKLLNDFYKQTTETLGDLSLEQIQKLPTDGTQVIKKELESRYQFPKADDKFNLDALGIDPSAAYAAYKVSNWKAYNFEFKKGNFISISDHQQPAITKHHHYADTPEKKQAVKLIRDLLELTDKLKEAGLVSQGRDAYLFDFLDYNVLTREKGIGRTPIIFNPSGCLQMLKEAGKKK